MNGVSGIATKNAGLGLGGDQGVSNIYGKNLSKITARRWDAI